MSATMTAPARRLPRLRAFRPGIVPVCPCGWPMLPCRASDGKPSRFYFDCWVCNQHDYPPSVPLDTACRYCGEPNVLMMADVDGHGWETSCCRRPLTDNPSDPWPHS